MRLWHAGEVFSYLIWDQFDRIRHGDRFWYENTRNGVTSWTPEEIEQINNVTLRGLVLEVTGVSDEEVQVSAFLL